MFSPRMNNFLFNLAAIFRVTAFDEMTKGKKKKNTWDFTQGWEPWRTTL